MSDSSSVLEAESIWMERNERSEYADYILEAFLYHLEISTNWLLPVYPAVFRIKKLIFKDQLHILNGFSVWFLLIKLIPIPIKRYSRSVIDLGNFELNGSLVFVFPKFSGILWSDTFQQGGK